MSGLGDLFGEAEGRAAREAGDAQLGGDRLDAVHTTVRRAHSRRAAMRTGLAAVVVVVLGGGLFYGFSHLGTVGVADSPAPSASPSVSPSATPSPSSTVPAMPAFAGTVTVDPHLPDASPITPEVWASAGPGWALISYQERWTDAGGADMHGPQLIYLVSPAGDRYELANLAGDTVGVLAWQAGATTAAVSVQPEGDPPSAGVLDLVTGAVTPVDGYAPYIWSLAFLDADGVPVYRGNDATYAYVRIGLDGTASKYTIPAEEGAAELAKAKSGATDCGIAAPYDDTSVLVTCSFDASGAFQAVERVNAEAGTVEELFRGEAGLASVTRAGDAAVAPTGSKPDACGTEYSELAGGLAVAVPGADRGLHPIGDLFLPFGNAGTAFTWGVTSGCTDGVVSPTVVVRSNLDAGTYSVLIPYPTDRPKGEEPYNSVTGVAVAR